MDRITLYNNKKDCCACGACMNVCTNSAISMVKDEYGFLFPYINEEKCVKCGSCKKVCAYQNVDEEGTPIATYAGAAKNPDIIKSASGGIFLCMATSIIQLGGVVYGSSFELIDNMLTPKHIGISAIEEICKLQGSKYVQSSIGFSYREIKNYLQLGRKVLFTGTPCQVAGLKSYLNKEYDNLILVDIICHGVPSAQFFQDYLSYLSKSNNGKIVGFKFREKSEGWGLNGVAECKLENGKIKKIPISSRLSSYYRLFLDSEIYRENCYKCKYASCYRVSDITIGDFWGIKDEHPKLIDENGGKLNIQKGISCIIVNSEKGKTFLNSISETMFLYSSNYERASSHNGQLLRPSNVGDNRNKVLQLYRTKGYKAVDKYFNMKVGYHRILKFRLLNYLKYK